MTKKDQELSTWQTFSNLWLMIAPFKIGLIIAAIALIINAISETFMLALLKPLLDEGFGNANKNFLVWMPFVVVALIVLRGISSFISSYCISWVSGNVVMQMRRKLFNHMMNMPVSFFDQQSTGTLLSRITYDSEQVSSSSSSALISVIRGGTSILSLFAMMFYYSWQLSTVLLIISPLVFFAMKLVSKKFRKISKKIQNTMGQVTCCTERMLKGHREVLIFGGKNIENNRFNVISDQIRQQRMNMVAAASVSDSLVQFIASLALAVVLYAASIPSVLETLTAGTITVVFSSMIALMRPLKSLTSVNTQFQRGIAACQTLFSILDLDTEKNLGKFKKSNIKGNIYFNNVTFYYPGQSKPSLNNINFSIASGTKVAIVGRSNSGKSTIINLLTRFYDIEIGNIYIDGVDIRDYELSYLRSQIALVSQDIYLFNDSIANNIAYACNKNYSRSDIEYAANMADAMHFINTMEKGLDTIIGENGMILSGGQRQRIAIARAILRDCPILIFDEATSDLDISSEKKIQNALFDINNKNKTLLIISHRLSTIKNADIILVIDNGYIVEQGTHNDLIESNSFYTKLYSL